MSADLQYESIKRAIKAKPGLQTLERVKEACDTLEADKVKITVASVGQYCELNYGKPKEGSIRNLKPIVAYIKERATEQSRSEQIQEDTKGISDPVALAYVQSLEARARMAERKFTALRKFVATQVPPLDIDKFLAETDPQQFAYLIKNSTAKTEPSKALKEVGEILTNPERLAEFGLEIYKGALRHKINGQVLLTRAQLEVLN